MLAHYAIHAAIVVMFCMDPRAGWEIVEQRHVKCWLLGFSPTVKEKNQYFNFKFIVSSDWKPKDSVKGDRASLQVESIICPQEMRAMIKWRVGLRSCLACLGMIAQLEAGFCVSSIAKGFLCLRWKVSEALEDWLAPGQKVILGKGTNFIPLEKCFTSVNMGMSSNSFWCVTMDGWEWKDAATSQQDVGGVICHRPRQNRQPQSSMCLWTWRVARTIAYWPWGCGWSQDSRTVLVNVNRG